MVTVFNYLSMIERFVRKTLIFMETDDFLKRRRSVRPQAESEKECKTAGLAGAGSTREPCKGARTSCRG